MHSSTAANFEQMALLMGGFMLGGLLLFVYQLYCLFDLMAKNSPVTESSDRVIWALLIVLVPLGIGAWLYQLRIYRRAFPVFYLLSFLLAVICLMLFMAQGLVGF